MRIRRILCGTDFSERSRDALALAVAAARRLGASLTLLHVSFPSGATDLYMLGPSSLGFQAWPTHRAIEELSVFARPAEAAGVPVELAVEEGEPAARIVARARSTDADLIVLGTQGLSGLERLVLGSVTEQVLRSAPCPVLTASPQGPPPESLFERILCAVDFSSCSAAALRVAAALAARTGGRLTLAHVVDQASAEDPRALLHFGSEEYVSFLEADAGERLRAMVPEAGPLPLLVRSGKPREEILRLAEETDATLLVIGAHARASMDSLLFGSTTKHVVRAAGCPVLTVRADAAERCAVLVEQATVA